MLDWDQRYSVMTAAGNSRYCKRSIYIEQHGDMATWHGKSNIYGSEICETNKIEMFDLMDSSI
jgi:hypothetical protein